MKTCRKDCIHGDVCGCRSYEEEICDNFKDKSLFIELPCKVGDTVYMPWEYDGTGGVAILSVTNAIKTLGFALCYGTDFETDDEGFADKYNNGCFTIEDIGKSIFLTKEEAQERLKNMRITCNECPHLNINEREQIRLKKGGLGLSPHICKKYNKRVLHYPYREPDIHPCDECITDRRSEK